MSKTIFSSFVSNLYANPPPIRDKHHNISLFHHVIVNGVT